MCCGELFTVRLNDSSKVCACAEDENWLGGCVLMVGSSWEFWVLTFPLRTELTSVTWLLTLRRVFMPSVKEKEREGGEGLNLGAYVGELKFG